MNQNRFQLMVLLLIAANFGPLRADFASTCSPDPYKVTYPGESLRRILDRIHGGTCTDVMLYQEDLPYTITRSGNYKIGELLLSDEDIAITVQTGTNDVAIDFCCRGILQTPSPTERYVIYFEGNGDNMVVKNGFIRVGPGIGDDVSMIRVASNIDNLKIINMVLIGTQEGGSFRGEGIDIENGEGIYIQDVIISNARQGIDVKASDGGRIVNVFMERIGDLGVQLRDSTAEFELNDVVIIDATGAAFELGNNMDTPCFNVILRNCSGLVANGRGFRISGNSEDVVLLDCVSVKSETGQGFIINDKSERIALLGCHAQSCAASGFFAQEDDSICLLWNCSSWRNGGNGFDLNMESHIFSSLAVDNGNQNFGDVDNAVIIDGLTEAETEGFYWRNLAIPDNAP